MNKVGGAHMASLVMKPDVIEFMTAVGNEKISLEEIVLSNLSQGFSSKTLNELQIRNKSGANIAGFKTTNGDYIVNPSAETKLLPYSKLFVLGTQEQIKSLKVLIG